MIGLNRVTLVGNLGHSPEISLSKNGKPYVRLSIATHRKWQTPEDEKMEATDWHSVFVWGELAERCAHMLRKGSLVLVEGSLTYWAISGQDKLFKNAIHAHHVQILSSSRENLDNQEPARNHNAVAHPA